MATCSEETKTVKCKNKIKLRDKSQSVLMSSSRCKKVFELHTCPDPACARVSIISSLSLSSNDDFRTVTRNLNFLIVSICVSLKLKNTITDCTKKAWQRFKSQGRVGLYSGCGLQGSTLLLNTFVWSSTSLSHVMYILVCSRLERQFQHSFNFFFFLDRHIICQRMYTNVWCLEEWPKMLFYKN